MKNRKNRIIHVAAATVSLVSTVLGSDTLLNYTFSAPRYKQAVYNRRGALVGANIGTIARPEIVPVDLSTGTESVAQFLARGGILKVGRTAKASGFVSQSIRVKSFRNVQTNCQPSRSYGL